MTTKKSHLETEATSRRLVLLYEGSSSNAVGEVTDAYWLARRRSVKPGLSNVYLHVMYKKAQKAGLPLLKIKDFVNKKPGRFGIPPELQALFKSDLVTVINPEKLRNEYVHASHRDWEDGDAERRWIANRTHFFDNERAVYPNTPGKAEIPVK